MSALIPGEKGEGGGKGEGEGGKEGVSRIREGKKKGMRERKELQKRGKKRRIFIVFVSVKMSMWFWVVEGSVVAVSQPVISYCGSSK